MDGQSVKTTEVGGTRGFDAYKRVKGRKRHILVDTLGLPIANRVEAADVSDRRAGALLTSGLMAIFPAITTVIADAGHESKNLARALAEQQGWRLQIVKRRQRAFKITGLTWIVERQLRLAQKSATHMSTPTSSWQPARLSVLLSWMRDRDKVRACQKIQRLVGAIASPCLEELESSNHRPSRIASGYVKSPAARACTSPHTG